MAFLTDMFGAFWTAFFSVALTHIPLIFAECLKVWLKLTTSTATDAAAPPEESAVETAAEEMPK
jgi:hypothetical protein